MFIDTNVLVMSRFIEAPNHEVARENLEKVFQGPEPVRISRQVIREYLAVLTRPQTWLIPITREEALDDIASLTDNFEILEDGPVVTDFLITLCRETPVGGRQIHDANIVATMLAYGERRLLTFNRGDFLRYKNRIDLIAA